MGQILGGIHPNQESEVLTGFLPRWFDGQAIIQQSFQVCIFGPVMLVQVHIQSTGGPFDPGHLNPVIIILFFRAESGSGFVSLMDGSVKSFFLLPLCFNILGCISLHWQS